MISTKIIIRGIVQGVFFREHIKKLANLLDLKGYVKNNENGTVEIVINGLDENIEQLLNFCYTGPKNAKVEGVEIEKFGNNNEFENFEIKY